MARASHGKVLVHGVFFTSAGAFACLIFVLLTSFAPHGNEVRPFAGELGEDSERNGPPPPPQWGITGRTIDVKVYLEGPYQASTGLMRQTLRLNLLIPVEQPYDASPWNYAGDEEGISPRHHPGVVDWVLLEFRDAPSAAEATQATVVKRAAAYLYYDGNIMGPNHAKLKVNFPQSEPEHGYFLVVRHRNHIDIMSSEWLDYDEETDTYSWDFTTGFDKVYRGAFGYKLIHSAENRYGMISGDATASGIIVLADYFIWRNQAGFEDYVSGDLTLSAFVALADYFMWRNNAGRESQVP